MNTDYEMVEQARDILLCHESKLANIAAKRKGNWGEGSSSVPHSLATSLLALQVVVHPVPPPASADPNVMDINHAKTLSSIWKCFKCGKSGHLMADCPLLMVLIRAAIAEALGVMGKTAGEEKKKKKRPAAGFV